MQSMQLLVGGNWASIHTKIAAMRDTATKHFILPHDQVATL